ncbi:MAG: phosphoribosylanthranilate isomerase [Opitutaceae bacterium]
MENVVIKVCGLTRDQDVSRTIELGANYFGFIVYEPSPRGLELSRAQELSEKVPSGQRVVVDVAPSLERLLSYKAAGFDYFQIHTETNVEEAVLAAWSKVVGASNLWLSPRLRPGEDFPAHFLPYADTFLVDTYSKNQVGGTGQTGDWDGFLELKANYPEKKWILAGGLSPSNISEAIRITGADHVDVNSGVEAAPRVKDLDLLRELFRSVREA